MIARFLLVLLAAAVFLAQPAAAQTNVSSSFTYQGRLDEGGTPVTGVYDFIFDLYQVSAGGAALATVPKNNVQVTNGLFTVTLDFSNQYEGHARWLDIRVKADAAGVYTTLTPRQELHATPYAQGVRLPLNESVTLNAPAFTITNNNRAIQGIVNAPSTATLPGFPAAILGTTTTGNGVIGATSATGGYGVTGLADSDNSFAVRGSQTSDTGRAGYFVVSNTANTANALEVTTNGAAAGQAFRAVHTGLGDCALFEITNAANVGECVEGHSNGAGDVIQAFMTGSGRAGYFQHDNDADSSPAVYVTTNGDNGDGLESVATGTFSNGIRGQGLSAGVRGDCSTTNGSGVYGVNNTSTGTGVRGDASGSGGAGVVGYGNLGTGVYGQSTGGGYGVYGSNGGSNSNGYAGYFNGRVHVTGTLSKGGGSFKIDHPLDPKGKYLSHSFVESPDMKNIYDGVASLDAAGEAVITLPDWFSTLNRDFRYQLTCIGGYSQVYVADEMKDNHFRIAGGKAGLKVSWQVTGIRQDPYANANRIPVEEEKDSVDRGHLLYPEAYGEPAAAGVLEAQRAARVAAEAKLARGE